MKLRLSPNKTTIRIIADEYQTLLKSEKLSQKFWVSNTKTMLISVYLAAVSDFKATDEGLSVYINKADFQQQKTKKDPAWELMVSSDFFISVEVDIIKNSDAHQEPR